MIRQLIVGLAKEIRHLYRKSKKLNDTDRYVLKTLIFYYLYCILLPLTIFVAFDKNILFLLFLPFIVYFIIESYLELREYDNRLIEMSKNFKYYAKQRIILLITKYWYGEL